MVFPLVKAVEKDKFVQNQLGSRRSNDSCNKMRKHMPNMEELLIQVSTDRARVQTNSLWTSKHIQNLDTVNQNCP